MSSADDSLCRLCGNDTSGAKRVNLASLRTALLETVQAKHPDHFRAQGFMCLGCLKVARVEHSIRQLELERGELSAVELEVATRAAAHEHSVELLEHSMWTGSTFGQRAADNIARVGGSWPFVISFIVILILWTTVNTLVLATDAFDPYPYILLNLVLSCVAALQAPIIIMSQNRSQARDRIQAEQDFRVNLKAEMELVSLHEKIDHLLHVQWDRMMEIQQTQLDILTELSAGSRSKRS